MVDILLAIVDFIPVGLFLAASIILQRDLYNKTMKQKEENDNNAEA